MPPYYITVLNYTVPGVSNYVAEQTPEGWTVSFSTSLFSALELHLHLRDLVEDGRRDPHDHQPWYNAVQYNGTITQLY